GLIDGIGLARNDLRLPGLHSLYYGHGSAPLQAFDVDAHAAGSARDGADGGFEIGRGEIRRLRLGNFFQLLARNLADLLGVGHTDALFNADGLADQHRRGRRLHDEGEAAVRVHRDDHGNRQTLLQLLGLRIELLAELHDVDALLTERRSDGRRRIRRARGHLQLHVALYFLRHFLLLGTNAALAGGSPLVTGTIAGDHTKLSGFFHL